jgi:hypothetical protein
MNKPLPLACLLFTGPFAFSALNVTVESFRDGNIPTGYAYTEDGIQEGEGIDLSAEPYLDYLVPNNSGSTGIAAQKMGGAYIEDSTVSELGSSFGTGGANKSNFAPDWYRPVFNWSDGTPLPFGSDYYGVSWGGFSDSVVATLDTQITFPDSNAVRIYHFFNDGWNYGTHVSLDGHHLTITQYSSGGAIKDQFFESLPSGGAEDLFGDGRQFYTAIIDISGQAAGDFILIRNEGANVGYEGTAVARGEEPPAPALEYAEGTWTQDSTFGYLYGVSGNWIYSPVMQFLYEVYPWVYSPKHGWLADFQVSPIQVGLYLYSPQLGLLWVENSAAGRFWIYAESRWDSF